MNTLLSLIGGIWKEALNYNDGEKKRLLFRKCFSFKCKTEKVIEYYQFPNLVTNSKTLKTSNSFKSLLRVGRHSCLMIVFK